MEQYKRERGLKAWLKRYVSLSFVIAVAALAYLMFFTDNSVATSYAQEMKNDSIRREIKIESDSLEYYRLQNQLLSTDRNTMEQIVRERFHMQRHGEDVYIIE